MQNKKVKNIKVAVGSQNPVKIEAVKSAFKKVFGDCEVVDVSVLSGVSDMPTSFSATVQGAKNRAQRAREKVDADFGVGLEGGLEDKLGETFLSGFVAIVDKDNVWGYGQGTGLLMPKKIIEKIRKENRELGDVMDEIRSVKNTKQHEGCVGFFTDNLISRQESFELPIIYALSRFTKKEMFEE